MNDIMKQLQAPFTPDCVEWRVGSTNADKTKGMALAYITNRAIQNRLDEVFGCFGWQNQYREWKGTSQICGISVWDKDKQDWITKWDGADDSQTEAVKGGLSDSMKRAAYQWGIGRYLYNLDSVWVEIEQCGKSYKIKKEPQLPAWALPEGYKQEPPRNKPEPPQHSQQDKISEIQAKAIKDRLTNMKCLDYVLKHYNLSKVEDMTPEILSKVNDWCNKQEAKKGQGAA